MNERVDDTSVSLIERARSRDPEAWKRIVRLYGPLVYYWCRDAGLPEHDAQDVGQDVFAAVSKSIEGFRQDRVGDTFRGWLRTITTNKIRDLARRGGTPGVGGEDHRDRLANWPADEPPTDTALSEEGSICRRALEFIRNEFEERTWRAFWRTAVDGQTSTAVAEELGTSPANVRKARSRILARLRRELAELVDFD